MAKSLFKLSMALKNVSTLPRYFCTARTCYNSNQLQEVNTEVTRPIAATTRELFDLIKKENNPSVLLSTIQRNKNILDGRHVVNALTAMHKFYKENKMSPAEIQNSEQFKTICSILNNHLLSLDMTYVFQALKIFNLIQIPASTVIMQSLLQLTRQSLNDLKLSEIFFMTFLLKRMEQTPLGDALLEALPLVFKAQYRLQLDRDDIKELANSLRFASDHIQDAEIIKHIVNAIDDFEGTVDIDSALCIFWSLSSIHWLPENYLNVLAKVNREISEYIDMLKPSDILKTLLDIATRESIGTEGFYNRVLVDKLIGKVIEHKYEFQKAILALHNANKMKHVNLKLLDYLLSQCCVDQNILRDCHVLSLLTLSIGFARANYKPKHWDLLKDLLVENHERLTSDHENYVYYALNLASLGCFDSKILARAFTFDYNLEVFNDIRGHRLKKLYYATKILYPEYNGPWPSDKLIASFENACINGYELPTSYPLLPALQNILKDSSLMKTNLMTKEGIYIDHLLLLKDGNFVAFESTADSKNIINVEDLNIPSEYKRVALLLIPAEVYGKNVQRLRAQVELSIKLLEALSYKVVTVPERLWNDMPENELMPYLRTMINIQKSSILNQVDGRISYKFVF